MNSFQTLAIPVDVNYFLQFIDGFCHMKKILSSVCKSWRTYFTQDIIKKEDKYCFNCLHGYNYDSQMAYEKYFHYSNYKVPNEFAQLIPIWNIFKNIDSSAFLSSKIIWANYDIPHMSALTQIIMMRGDKTLLKILESGDEDLPKDMAILMPQNERIVMLLISALKYSNLPYFFSKISYSSMKFFDEESCNNLLSMIIDLPSQLIQKFLNGNCMYVVNSIKSPEYINSLLMKLIENEKKRDEILKCFKKIEWVLFSWIDKVEVRKEYAYFYIYYGRVAYDLKKFVDNHNFDFIRELIAHSLIDHDLLFIERLTPHELINAGYSRENYEFKLRIPKPIIKELKNIIFDFPYAIKFFEIDENDLYEKDDNLEISIKINSRRNIKMTRFQLFKLLNLMGTKRCGRYKTPVNKIIEIMKTYGLLLKNTDIKIIYDMYPAKLRE